jgi:hypothetical protein
VCFLLVTFLCTNKEVLLSSRRLIKVTRRQAEALAFACRFAGAFAGAFL